MVAMVVVRRSAWVGMASEGIARFDEPTLSR
jgi:hypothetical protein